MYRHNFIVYVCGCVHTCINECIHFLCTLWRARVCVCVRARACVHARACVKNFGTIRNRITVEIIVHYKSHRSLILFSISASLSLHERCIRCIMQVHLTVLFLDCYIISRNKSKLVKCLWFSKQ